MKKIKKQKIIMRRRLTAIIIIIVILIILLLLNDKKSEEVFIDVVETFSSISYSQDFKKRIIESIKEPELKIPEISSKSTDWELILLNRNNKKPENYEFELEYIENGNRVDKRIASTVTQMLKDARSEGLNPYICSSYRNASTQRSLFNQKVNQYKWSGYSNDEAKSAASYWVAIPQTSEHEIGLALDIVSENFKVLDKRQENTDVQKWLMEHCVEYGFILRYPSGKKDITKINYEPWHYRYVGVKNAKFMKEKNLCLEEFIDYLKQYE